MQILQLINDELVRWEQQKQLAEAEWHKANAAIEALYYLTERMKQEAINENHKPNGETQEAAAGN